MGLFEKLLLSGGVAIAGIAAKRVYGNFQETRRRKSSPLQFTEALSPMTFNEIVQEAARKTPRVKGIAITGMTVDLHIRSNTGLTSWNTEVDFNDYGRLTGTYWLNSENKDSVIPKFFADLVESEIIRRINSSEII